MQTKLKKTVAGITLLVISLPLVTNANMYQAEKRSGGINSEQSNYVNTLSEDSIEKLKSILTDEYLAYNIYNELGNSFDNDLYKEISKAELNHISAIKRLLGSEFNESDYLVDNSVLDNYKIYYDNLDNKNQIGIDIENKDIKDIEDNIDTFEDDNIKKVLNNLLNASKKHLEMFQANLTSDGIGKKKEEHKTEMSEERKNTERYQKSDENSYKEKYKQYKETFSKNINSKKDLVKSELEKKKEKYSQNKYFGKYKTLYEDKLGSKVRQLAEQDLSKLEKIQEKIDVLIPKYENKNIDGKYDKIMGQLYALQELVDETISDVKEDELDLNTIFE